MSKSKAIKKTNILFALILFALCSCTRSGSNDAQVRLSLPSTNSSSNKLTSLGTIYSVETPAHIVVSITASGMTPVYYLWDAQGGQANPDISLSVPQGPARLVQVLYVTEDGNKSLYFYYNDITQDFTSANISISMIVNSLNSTTTQGRIVGKYLDSSGNGPTGILKTFFQPPGGKPVMQVDQNEIFGGWFNAFGLPGQALTYVFEDGKVLLKDFTVSSSSVSGTANALINVPASYRKFNGSSSPDANGGTSIIAGFFGPGSVVPGANKNICVNPASASPIPSLFYDSVASSSLAFNGSGTCDSPLTQACLVGGGLATPTDWNGIHCPVPDNINYVKFSDAQLADKDSNLLFKGPFALTATAFGTTGLNGNLSGSNLSLNWTYQTGATAGLEAVEVFYKWADSIAASSGNPEYSKNNGYDCAHLVSTYGFSSGGRFPISATSTPAINVGASSIGKTLVAILCPLNTSHTPIYYSSAVRWSGQNSTPIINISAVSGSETTLSVSECKHFQVKLTNADNSPFFTPTPLNVSLSFKTPSPVNYGGFSTDSSGCSGSVNNMNYTITAGSNKTDIYFSSTQADYFQIRAHIDGYGIQNGIKNIGVATGGATAINIYMYPDPAFGIPLLASGYCYPVEARLELAGKPATYGSAASLTATPSSMTGYFYQDANCSTAHLNVSDSTGASITVPMGEHSKTIYFSPDVTSAIMSAGMTASSCSPGTCSGVGSIHGHDGAQNAAPYAYTFTTDGVTNNQFDPGRCVAVQISASNRAMVGNPGAPILPATDESISVSAVGGTLSVNSCSSNSFNGAILVPAHSAPPVVYLNLSPTSTAATVNVNDGVSTQAFNLSLRPPNGINWAGASNLVGTGLCYPAVIKAKGVDGADYLFPNDQNLNPSGSGVNFYSDSACSSATVSSLNFFAGSAIPTVTRGGPTYYMMFTNTSPSLSFSGTNFNLGQLNIATTNIATVFDSAPLHTGTTAHFVIQGTGGVVVTPNLVPSFSGSVNISGSPFGGNGCPSPYVSCVAPNFTANFINNASVSSTQFYFTTAQPSGSTSLTFFSSMLTTLGFNVLPPPMPIPY